MESCELIKIERVLKTKGKEGTKSWKEWHEWKVAKTVTVTTTVEYSSDVGEMFKGAFWTLGHRLLVITSYRAVIFDTDLNEQAFSKI